MTTIAPLVFLGMILLAYWARVARMARKAHRRDRQGANFIPPERAGRWVRVIWGPIVTFWIFNPFIVAFSPRLPMALMPLFFNASLAWVMTSIVWGGFVLSRICWKAMGKHWRMGIDPNEKNPLIDKGPFAYARHPIYALSAMMMLATMAAIPSPLMLAVAGMHLALLVWEARREEAHMLGVHGEPYAEYCRRVNAFFPKRSVEMR